MRAHVIEGGKVANTIEVELLDFMPNLIDASIGGMIGDLWDGANFTKPPTPEPTPAPTKEQLMAELQTLTAKIQALE